MEGKGEGLAYREPIGYKPGSRLGVSLPAVPSNQPRQAHHLAGAFFLARSPPLGKPLPLGLFSVLKNNSTFLKIVLDLIQFLPYSSIIGDGKRETGIGERGEPPLGERTRVRSG